MTPGVIAAKAKIQYNQTVPDPSSGRSEVALNFYEPVYNHTFCEAINIQPSLRRICI